MTKEAEDLCDVMALKAGRRYLWRLLGNAGLFEACYSPEAEGARRHGLLVQQEILEVCPKQYLLMQKEAIEDAEEQKRLQAEAAKDSDGADND